MVNRRHFLAMTGLLTTAGCLSSNNSSRTPKPAPDEYNTYDEPVFTDSGRVTIREGEFKAFEFSHHRKMKLIYDLFVMEYVDIDIIGYDEDDFEKYKQNDYGGYNPRVSEFETDSAEMSGFLDPGKHALVLDNTDDATDAADSAVTVKYTIKVLSY